MTRFFNIEAADGAIRHPTHKFLVTFVCENCLNFLDNRGRIVAYASLEEDMRASDCCELCEVAWLDTFDWIDTLAKEA